MAVAYVSGADNVVVNGYSLDVGSAQFRYVMVFWGEGQNTLTKFTTLTFGGESMVKIEEAIGSTGVQIWGLAIPNDWTGNKSFAGTGTRGHIVLVSGVDLDDPVLDSDSAYSNDGNDDACSLSGIACKNIGGVFDILSVYTNTAMTPGANQTEFPGWEVTNEKSLSYYTTPVSGDITMSWTFTNARNAQAAISLRPHVSKGGIRWIF